MKFDGYQDPEGFNEKATLKAAAEHDEDEDFDEDVVQGAICVAPFACNVRHIANEPRHAGTQGPELDQLPQVDVITACADEERRGDIPQDLEGKAAQRGPEGPGLQVSLAPFRKEAADVGVAS